MVPEKNTYLPSNIIFAYHLPCVQLHLSRGAWKQKRTIRNKILESQRYYLTDFIEYVFYVIQVYKHYVYSGEKVMNPYHNSEISFLQN